MNKAGPQWHALRQGRRQLEDLHRCRWPVYYVVMAVAVDGMGRLWFDTDGGGVSVMDDGAGTRLERRATVIVNGVAAYLPVVLRH